MNLSAKYTIVVVATGMETLDATMAGAQTDILKAGNTAQTALPSVREVCHEVVKGDISAQETSEGWTRVSNKKGIPKKVQQSQMITRHGIDATSCSNPYAALDTMIDAGGRIAGENLQLVERNDAQNFHQNSSSTPAMLNLTSIGAQILENMNPLHVFTGNLAPKAIAHRHKGVTDNSHGYKVGLNTSHHEIPSNDAISLSEDSVHPTDTREAISSNYYASKKPTKKDERNDATQQNLYELEESGNLKTWADQVEDEEEEYDSDKKYEEDEDDHISNSWADQVEEEEGNKVEYVDSYMGTVRKDTHTANAKQVNTPSSKASTWKKNLQLVQHEVTVKVQEEHALISTTVLPKKIGLSPNAPVLFFLLDRNKMQQLFHRFSLPQMTSTTLQLQ